MLFKMTELKYQPNPVLARALDVLFILHADHEQNCSTTTMRTIGSSHADPYSALAGAAAALYGPLHGGANEAVLRMLNEIGSVAKVPGVHQEGEGRRRQRRLMGFGHRVYKSYDPRAKVIKRIADLVFAVTGKNPLLEIALELERIALQDDYFVIAQAVSERRLLLRPDLPGDGLPGRDVPGALRDPAHRRLDRAVGRDAARSRPEDRAPAPDLHRTRRARLRAAREALMRTATSTTHRSAKITSHKSQSLCVCFVALASSWSLLPFAQSGSKFDSNRAWEHLRQMVAIGPRPAGSPAIEQTRKYIKDQLAASGVTVVEQAWDTDTPLGKVHMVNLIATIPGAAKQRILVTGHYDTKLFREFRFVGASDGASSAAFLIELARVLKARKNALTFDLVFLDGEEAVCKNWDDCSRPALPTTRTAAATTSKSRKRDGSLAAIKANILVDMIADRNLRLKRESYSTQVADRHRLGHRQAAEARHVLRASDHTDRGRSSCISRRRRAVGRHHRPRVRAVAHRQRHARRRQRPQPPDRRRRHPRRAPGN